MVALVLVRYSLSQIIGLLVQFLCTHIVRNNLFEMEPVLDRSIVYRNIYIVSERETICNVVTL
jgi:hypothetical protein